MSLSNGFTLIDLNPGIAKVEGNYKYGNWGLKAAEADVTVGAGRENVDAYGKAKLASVSGGVKIPLPFSDAKLSVTVEGDIDMVEELFIGMVH